MFNKLEFNLKLKSIKVIKIFFIMLLAGSAYFFIPEHSLLTPAARMMLFTYSFSPYDSFSGWICFGKGCLKTSLGSKICSLVHEIFCKRFNSDAYRDHFFYRTFFNVHVQYGNDSDDVCAYYADA